MLNYVKDMFRVYEDKPKFMFAFHGELSHDYANKVAVAEQDLVEWLEWFQKSGYLNNTMLVFMSDHGQRYGCAVEFKTLDSSQKCVLVGLHQCVTRNRVNWKNGCRSFHLCCLNGSIANIRK